MMNARAVCSGRSQPYHQLPVEEALPDAIFDRVVGKEVLVFLEVLLKMYENWYDGKLAWRTPLRKRILIQIGF